MGEVAVKFFIQRRSFFSSKLILWNLLDLTIVSIWLVFNVLTLSMGRTPMLVRALRLARLVRLMRIVHYVRMLDSLFLLIKSIESSISILVWSLVLLLFLMMVLAIYVGTLLIPFMRNPDVDEGVRQMVYEK